jgi:hypothetical protein
MCNQTITHIDVQKEKGDTVWNSSTNQYETQYRIVSETEITEPDTTCIAVGASVGTLLLLGAAVMLPVSLVPLIFSKMIYSIYHKSTGEKLLATFTGGYNWDRKEITFAMNIKF